MYQSNAYRFRFLFFHTAQYNNLNQNYKISDNIVNPAATMRVNIPGGWDKRVLITVNIASS